MPCNENEWPTEVKNHASPYSISRRRYPVVLYLLAISREKIPIRVHAPYLSTYLPPFAAFGTVYTPPVVHATIVINHYVESGRPQRVNLML